MRERERGRREKERLGELEKVRERRKEDKSRDERGKVSLPCNKLLSVWKPKLDKCKGLFLLKVII